MDNDVKCPLQKPYGDTVCVNGWLMALTYSEMGPPDSRQCVGECPYCQPMNAEKRR